MGNNLKELRKKRSVKVDTIVECLGISMVYYYDLEKGERRFNEDLLKKLADFYNVSIDYILGRTDHENIVILEGSSLPDKLQGVVDSIGMAKDAGLSDQDINEILELHAKLQKKKS